jgi:hypothetical protein
MEQLTGQLSKAKRHLPTSHNDQISAFFESSYTSLNDYLNAIGTKVDNYIVRLKNEDYSNHNDLDEAISALEIVILFFNELVPLLPIDRREIIVKELKEVEFSLLCLLKAICASCKKQDYFMLKDLLEFELKDNLSEWKVKIISKLKEI